MKIDNIIHKGVGIVAFSAIYFCWAVVAMTS